MKDKLEEALETFTADRIGIPDYALESYGNQFISVDFREMNYRCCKVQNFFTNLCP